MSAPKLECTYSEEDGRLIIMRFWGNLENVQDTTYVSIPKRAIPIFESELKSRRNFTIDLDCKD